MSKKQQQKSPIKIEPNATIGDPDAGCDSYLEECFVETGAFKSLLDRRDAKSLLVGRTGTGKTACIQRIKQLSDRYSEVDVAQKFLGYISNLNWLKDMADTDGRNLNLSLFFKNMWQDIILVSIITKIFPSRETFQERYSFFSSKKEEKKRRQKLVEYVDSYGPEFWNPSHNACEVAQSTIKKIGAKVDLTLLGTGVGASYQHENTAQSGKLRDDIHDLFRKQLAPLQEAIKGVHEYVSGDNSQRPFYVLIDKLDEEWIDESIRYQLIRALVEVVRNFNQGNKGEYPIKVVVALRQDLIEKVYEATRSSGFQSEKYHSFETRLEWSKNDLASIVNTRIESMCQRQYTNQPISIQDLAPVRLGKGRREKDKELLDYIIERTLGRPRDVISFVNHILHDLGKTQQDKLTLSALYRVEEEYSAGRFNSIMDEWQTLYPNLKVYASVLEQLPKNFVQFRGIVENLVIGADSSNDPKLDEWVGMIEDKSHKVAVDFLGILYRTGLVRVKLNAASPVMAYPKSISPGQHKKEMSIRVHPMLYGKFGTDSNNISEEAALTRARPVDR